ncbi:hypothetical protein [Mucilaginibacter terrae]|uniref:Uncharacterized protein n=1 Tax=Mucilaginibacter terrae TaxID=1955052 RepID=A0ABU3GU64_9SPHI|nr:hypothetical protein [Mucilaginibacter terrae]MDT3403313.1 hypothetical protein [Mucilaginibacter terrae]
MLTPLLKYITIVCLLAGILEYSQVPVISVWGNHAKNTEQTDKGSAEDPVKESENIRAESAKDYLHEINTFRFSQPVFVIAVKHPIIHREDFPYHFYPDVLTPPPNC